MPMQAAAGLWRQLNVEEVRMLLAMRESDTYC